MIETLAHLFSYSFAVRAFVVGSLVSLCAGLLGITLVLKRYSMIGDGLSHVGYGAFSIALALQVAPLALALPIVVLAAFFLLRLQERSHLKGDAAIAVISTSALAIGIIVTSLSSGLNVDAHGYLFGSILALTRQDVILSIGLAVLVLPLYFLLYNNIFAVTFDETFARATGTKASIYNTIVAFLTAITIVIGMRMMGALLISSLIIFPSLTAMRLCRSFRSVVLWTAVSSWCCFFVGILLSYRYAIPAGASIVVVNLTVFLVCSLIGWVKRRTR